MQNALLGTIAALLAALVISILWAASDISGKLDKRACVERVVALYPPAGPIEMRDEFFNPDKVDAEKNRIRAIKKCPK